MSMTDEDIDKLVVGDQLLYMTDACIELHIVLKVSPYPERSIRTEYTVVKHIHEVPSGWRQCPALFFTKMRIRPSWTVVYATDGREF